MGVLLTRANLNISGFQLATKAICDRSETKSETEEMAKPRRTSAEAMRRGRILYNYTKAMHADWNHASAPVQGGSRSLFVSSAQLFQ